MNSVKLERNKGFEFKLEPNFLDERKIQQEISNILGGWEKYADLDTTVAKAYQEHLELNEAIFGKEEFKKKYSRYLELIREETDTEIEELNQLRKELNNNKSYRTYIALIREKTLVNQYAELVILCLNKPNDFIFEQQNDDKIFDLYAEYQEVKKKQTSVQGG